MTKNSKTTKTATKSLNLSTIETVDDQGAVVANAMSTIAAEVRVDVASEQDPDGERKPLATNILDLPIFGTTIEERIYTPFPHYANCLSFGQKEVTNKWHPHSHWKIMGILNGAASLRLGHYVVVEEGVHLMHTPKELATGMLYEGKFGYIDWEKASLEWIKFMESHGVKHDSGKTGWNCIKVSDDGDLFSAYYLAKKERLEEVAKRLNKEIHQLSPITVNNWTEGRNTQNKRRGVEALLRASKGLLKIVPSLKIENDGQKWMIAHEFNRNQALFGSLEALAKDMAKGAKKGQDQLDIDQGGYILNQAPELLEEKLQTVGELVAYGGQSYTVAQLVRANVIMMSGDAEVGSTLYLRDPASVVNTWAKRVNLAEGKTLKVVKLAA